jgi:hypothetical protein
MPKLKQQKNLRFILFLCLIFSNHGLAKSSPVNILECKGTYSGTLFIYPEYFHIRFQHNSVRSYDSYNNFKPYTGGHRLLVYFETDGDMGADYALFIYRDFWTLRKEYQPGWYKIEIAEGNVIQSPFQKSEFHIFIPQNKISEEIQGTWNYEMP